MKTGTVFLGLFLSTALTTFAAVTVTVERNDGDKADASFKFKTVPPPAKTDSGAKAVFSIVGGQADRNSGGIGRLNDGAMPTEEDSPEDNFFFQQGTDGGRIAVDLKDAIEIKQINTYSWHPGSRGPQVYKLYTSDGAAKDFDAKPAGGKDPLQCGWKLLASVDTRRDGKALGGQYGVSIADPDGNVGRFRYLLFACSQTEGEDPFGNTFYSEIDVVGKDDVLTSAVAVAVPLPPIIAHSPDGKCEVSIDVSGAPDLKDWAETKLAPALAEWYPKIAVLLPSEDYEPPAKFSVIIKPGRGVAATGGRRVTANANWLKRELNREAVGSLIHEEVHVIQQYGRGRRNNPNPTESPGWLVEGIADYIRFYHFEPQNHGADISERGIARARYNGSYRVTANFLNWVSEHYDKEVVRRLNAAMREAKYTDDIWKTNTGKTVQELGDEWKADLEKKFKTAETKNTQ